MNLKEALYSDRRLRPIDHPIPAKDDLLVADVLRELREKDSTYLDQVAADLTNEDRATLDGFACHFATWAVRAKSVELIELGLFALEMAERNVDYSECESFPLLFDALKKVGLNPKAKCKELAPQFTGQMRAALEYAGRRGAIPVYNTRFRESADQHGFKYTAIM
jgi:hypothetical protein